MIFETNIKCIKTEKHCNLSCQTRLFLTIQDIFLHNKMYEQRERINLIWICGIS